MLVFDQRKPDMVIAVLSETDPRRHGDFRLGQQMLGEFERAFLPERLRDLGPDEHRRLRLFDFPADPVQPIDQDVPPVMIHLDHLFHALLRTVQGDDGGDLDRLKNAVVEVAFQLGQGGDHLRIPDAKTDPPSRHVIAFRQGEKFDADLLRPRRLQKARRLVAVEYQVGIGQVMHHQELVLFGEIDDLFEEVEVHHLRGRVVRKIDDQHFRLGPGLPGRRNQILEKIAAGCERDRPDFSPGNDHAVGVNRVGGARRQHDIPRSNGRQRQVGNPLFRSDGDDRFPLGIEIDRVVPPIPVGDGKPQLGDSLRGGVAMISGVLQRLDRLVDDVGRRRLVGVSHPEVDDVFAAMPRIDLHGVDHVKHIWRKPLDPRKVVHDLLQIGKNKGN